MTPPSAADLSSLAAHQGRVRSLVRALLRDEHAADDVVQEAWVRTLETGPRDPGALRAWFERVARRIALNRLRGERRRDRRERDTARDEALPSSADIAAEVELERRLLDALEALPEPHRSALRDRYLGELTPTEIARRDGLSVDTVKSRLSRGRALMREQLDERTGGSPGHWRAVFLPLATPSREVSAPAAASAAAVTSTAVLGTLAMKKLALAASVALVSIVAWQAWPDERVPVDATSTAEVERIAPSDDLATAEPNATTAAAADGPTEPRVTDVMPATTVRRTETVAASEAWTVGGTVRWHGEEPQPPASPVEVSLRLWDGSESSGEPKEERVVSTDATGGFAWAPERQSGTVTITARVLDDELFVLAIDPITVEAGADEARFSITLVPRDGTLFGRVMLPDGEPARGATVRWSKFKATADADGDYELAVAPRWTHYLTALADGYGQDVKDIDGMTSGGSKQCDFQLLPELRVHGVVRDEAGRAIEGARIRTFYGRDLDATTDAQGRYEIRHLSRTTRPSFMIFARKDGLCEAREDRRIPESGVAEVDFVMQSGARVAGRVVGPKGDPLPGVELYIGFSQFAYNRLDATSATDGSFAFPVVPRGTQRLWAQLDGYAPFDTQIDIAEGVANVPDVVVELGEGRTLVGVVRDAAGDPLEGISVAGTQEHEYVGKNGSSDADGRFEVVDLPAGKVTLEAYGGDFVRKDVEVAANHAGDVEIVMELSGVVRGRVVDGATGEPIRNFTIRFADPILEEGDVRVWGYSARWSRQGRTFDDASGAWDTSDEELEIGKVIGIQASATGYAAAALPRAEVVSRDSDSEVVIELWKPVTLHVDVVQAGSREPVAGVEVIATQEHRRGEYDDVWEDVTGANGSAKLEDVPPGPLFVKVTGQQWMERKFGPFEIAHDEPVQRIELELGASGSIVGVTRDDATGAAVGNVPVRLHALQVEGVQHQQVDSTSDAEGAFSFTNLAPGLYQLSRLAPNGGNPYAELSLKVWVGVQGDRVERDVRAPEGSATISGSVTAAHELPDGAKVSLLSNDREKASFTTLTKDGRYEFTGIPAGKYTVSVLHIDSAAGLRLMGHAQTVLTDGQRVEANVEMVSMN